MRRRVGALCRAGRRALRHLDDGRVFQQASVCLLASQAGWGRRQARAWESIMRVVMPNSYAAAHGAERVLQQVCAGVAV
jgi:hypothetical protein